MIPLCKLVQTGSSTSLGGAYSSHTPIHVGASCPYNILRDVLKGKIHQTTKFSSINGLNLEIYSLSNFSWPQRAQDKNDYFVDERFFLSPIRKCQNFLKVLVSSFSFIFRVLVPRKRKGVRGCWPELSTA